MHRILGATSDNVISIMMNLKNTDFHELDVDILSDNNNETS